jgi:hypothetical protein
MKSRFTFGGNRFIRVDEYRRAWPVDKCHTNYAIPSRKGGFLVTAVYGNAPQEVAALRAYFRV